MKEQTNFRGALSKSEIRDLNLDLEDLHQLDSFDLKANDKKKGIAKSLIFTAIAIFIFYSNYD